MRINIYEEELTDEVTLITKHVPQGGGTVETFYGVRFWLESPQAIIDHSTPEDDDRNAITFWVRESGRKDLVRLWELAYEAMKDVPSSPEYLCCPFEDCNSGAGADKFAAWLPLHFSQSHGIRTNS